MSEARLVVAPIDSRETFKDKAYTALRNVIMSSDIYRSRTDIRLDERQLAQDFGISRTPVREAMAQLEREGFVRSVPRRGVYVVRKTKQRGDRADPGLGGAREHGGAPDHRAAPATRTSPASGACSRPSRATSCTPSSTSIPRSTSPSTRAIIELSGNQALIRLAANLFTHMRMIRGATIGEDDRVDRSIRDHMNIIQALEARDTERAEDLVRQHALGLAEHVAKHADYLD